VTVPAAEPTAGTPDAKGLLSRPSDARFTAEIQELQDALVKQSETVKEQQDALERQRETVKEQKEEIARLKAHESSAFQREFSGDQIMAENLDVNPDRCLEGSKSAWLDFFVEPGIMSNGQLVFISGLYAYMLLLGGNMIGDGSELLLLVPSWADLIGSVVLPVLGAVPDGLMVLFSGLGRTRPRKFRSGSAL
jgi:hypothetical protein